MCVKCGINSCGSCNGKTSQFLTGQMFYDGNPVPCSGIGAIAVGDNLNTILENMGLTSCANEAYIANQNLSLYHDFVDSGFVLAPSGGGNDFKVGDTFIIPEDGNYTITATISVVMAGTGGATNLGTSFYFGVANPQTFYAWGTQWPISIINAGADVTKTEVVTINATFAGTNGQIIELVTPGLDVGAVGSITIIKSQVTIQKIG